MSGLASITETCEPRDDVRGGQLSDQMFAANLDTIVRDRASYPVYGDPEQFFALTHPTRGVRRLLERTFGRLSGAKVPGAEHGVIRLQTTFGGGKTHGLIVTFYLAEGARPSNLDQFIDPALLPDSCQVAAVVGDALDPVAGVPHDGFHTLTMWGEIAAQLGCYDDMRSNDEQRSAPGTGTWDKVLGTTPTVIIIDEVAAHLRQLLSSGSEDARRQATAVPVFLKNLFEYAGAHPNVVVILTLATRSDAFGRETSEIEDLLTEAEEVFQSTLADTKSALARSESIIRPAEDNEIAQILKTRLFKHIDPAAAAAAAAAFRPFYEELAEKGQALEGGADQPTSYAESIESSYPFHPELVRVLDKRLGAIPNFQRARGALKLLAEVIAGMWDAGKTTEIINVADIDLGIDPVLTHLTVGLGRDEYEGVARVDICGGSSHAAAIDKERFSTRRPFATRAATTVFLHSLEQTATAGAPRGAYLLGTLETGDDPAVIEEALSLLQDRAWHLDYDGSRYRFLTEPNANAIVAEEARNIPKSQVSVELEERIANAFGSDGPVTTRINPSGPVDVPNEARLQLVVVHHDDVSVTARSATPPPERVIDIRENAGASGFRTYRNGVVFLVADADQVENMKDRVRWAMATDRTCNSPDRLAQFSPQVRKKIEALADTAGMEMKVAIARCYSHLYYPFADAHNSHLRHYEMPPKEKGSIPPKLTKTIPEALRDEGKIRDTKPATDYLKQKAWPKDAPEVTTSEVADFFWQDYSMAIILDPSLLKETIRDGVKNGTWIYYDSDQQRAWTANEPPPPVALESSAILYTPERAEELGLLRRPLRIDDVSTVLSGPLTGPQLREALEGQLGHEPPKGEIAAALARGAAGGPAAKVVVVIGEVAEGMKAATQAQIEKASFDALTVMTLAEAQSRGIDLGGTQKGPRPVEGRGLAGIAMGQVAEKALDVSHSTGIAALLVTATADPGEGIKDIRALGQVIPRLPKFDVEVQLDLSLSFSGLTQGVSARLSGQSAAYLAIEDQLLALSKSATQVAGSMSVTIRPENPIVPDGTEFGVVKKALVDLDPGELTIKAELA
jgi:hypothetical protein